MGAMEMSNPFWPMYVQSLPGAHNTFAFTGIGIYVLPMLGMALTSVWWGRAGDRLGHKWMMIRALLGLSLTQCLLAYSTTATEILILRFIQGALAGFIAPAQAYAANLQQQDKPYKIFASLQIATNIGSLLGAMAGGLIWDLAPFYWINLAAALLCCMCACAVWYLLPAQSPARVIPTETSNAVPTTTLTTTTQVPLYNMRTLLLGLMIVLGIMIGARMILQVPFSLYTTTQLHLDKTTTGLLYGLMALGFCVTASYWARYFESRSNQRILQTQLGITAAMALIAAYLGMINQSMYAFALGQLLWGMCLAASTPVLTAFITRNTDPGQRGKTLGQIQSITQLFSVLGICLGGTIVHIEALPFVYHYVVLLYLLGFIGLFVLVMRLNRHMRHTSHTHSAQR
jgi:MFS family permease